MEIWLQRFSTKLYPDIEYTEPLCRLVRNESAAIWNSDWIDLPKLNNAIDPKKFIDKEELRKVGAVIPNKEIRLFDVPYHGNSLRVSKHRNLAKSFLPKCLIRSRQTFPARLRNLGLLREFRKARGRQSAILVFYRPAYCRRRMQICFDVHRLTTN